MTPLHRIPVFIVVALTCLSAKAQFYKMHNADIGVGGFGQFTTSITNQTNTNHQATTDSAGALVSFRDTPASWAGIELNYSYSSFSERFTSLYSRPLAYIPLSLDEFSAAYLVRPRLLKLKPFVGVGGASLFFHPASPYTDVVWRAAGLVEVGLDLPTSNPHVGFRIQGRSLYYRAPNFNDANIATSRWVAATEPSASVFLRF